MSRYATDLYQPSYASEPIRVVRGDVLALLEQEHLLVRHVPKCLAAITAVASDRLWDRLERIALDPARRFVNRAICAAAMMHARRQPGRLRSRADAELFFDAAFAGLVMEGEPNKIGAVVWDALRGLPPEHASLVLEPLDRWRVPAVLEAWWVFDETMRRCSDSALVERVLRDIEPTREAESWLFELCLSRGDMLGFIDAWRAAARASHPAVADAEVWRWKNEDGEGRLTVILPVRRGPTEHGFAAAWEARADLDVAQWPGSVDLLEREAVRALREELTKRVAEPLVPAFIGRTACDVERDLFPVPMVLAAFRMLAPPSAHFRERPFVFPKDVKVELLPVLCEIGGGDVFKAIATNTLVSSWLSNGGYRSSAAIQRMWAKEAVSRFDQFSVGRHLQSAKDGVVKLPRGPWQEDVLGAADRLLLALEGAELDDVVELLASFCLLVHGVCAFAPTDGMDGPALSVLPLPQRARLAAQTLRVCWTSPRIHVERGGEIRADLAPIFAEINGATPEQCERVFEDLQKTERVFVASGHVLLPEWRARQEGLVDSGKGGGPGT